ncbi:hypothetical protein INS49_012324 [Diaporthe citri]|uniref:uncharacterized protein n=1 Tax=Diaporthe citri TaxID=83186 RepID=UPI001C7FAD9D|nr:uncharacterized protein INS49_012324 [Diaporthe citri]KAG6358805.1 hypothetical protein INS49_012324 [Diaporthe citri]
MRHPEVANYTDIGQLLFGRIGREMFGAAFVIVGIFVMASHLLTWTIALNTLSNHGTCTIVFGVVGIVVFALLTVPRTLKNVSFLAIISFMSIMSAVLITIIALAVSPRAAYDTMQATLHPSLPTAFNSISNIVFAWSGHLAWVSFILELRDPREFSKALLVQQAFMMVAPALGSTSKTVAKVTWGIAIPTIIIAGVIFAHVMAKYIFLRLFRDTPYLHSRGFVATGTRIGIGGRNIALAFVNAAQIAIGLVVFGLGL